MTIRFKARPHQPLNFHVVVNGTAYILSKNCGFQRNWSLYAWAPDDPSDIYGSGRCLQWWDSPVTERCDSTTWTPVTAKRWARELILSHQASLTKDST